MSIEEGFGAEMIGHINDLPAIPNETFRAARAVFSSRNFYILVGEQLEFIMEDFGRKNLSDTPETSKGMGVMMPLITFFQFAEGLTDVQAMDAVRTRIDWKYALHLPVNTMTIHQNLLCHFRQRIKNEKAGQRDYQKIVDRLITLNPPLHHNQQDFEVLALLSHICSINVSHWALEAMCAALGALAGRYPEWMRTIALPHWYWRYNHLHSFADRISSTRQHDFTMEKLGADIHYLLEEVHSSRLHGITDIQEITTLHCIWEQHFKEKESTISPDSGNVKWIHCNSCSYYAG